jgi:uncharacterized protein (DUF697 family)
MKNSREYSQKIKKLHRSLKNKYPKVEKVVYEEPVNALVHAIICEKTNEKSTQSIVKRSAEHFVDLNDLRVSLIEEISEVFGADVSDADAKEVGARLATALTWVFNKYNLISLANLKKIGKKPAKDALEKIQGTNHFVVNYCILTALQGHAIPLTEKMIAYLKDNELVHPEADEQEIEGFLTKQISAKEAYEFYYFLRSESETSKKPQKEKTTVKTTKKAGTIKTKKAKK